MPGTLAVLKVAAMPTIQSRLSPIPHMVPRAALQTHHPAENGLRIIDVAEALERKTHADGHVIAGVQPGLARQLIRRQPRGESCDSSRRHLLHLLSCNVELVV